MKVWIAMDRDGSLNMFWDVKPEKHESTGQWSSNVPWENYVKLGWREQFRLAPLASFDKEVELDVLDIDSVPELKKRMEQYYKEKESEQEHKEIRIPETLRELWLI